MKILVFLDYYASGGIEHIITDLKNNIKNIEVLSFCNLTNDKVITLNKKVYKNFLIRNILSLNKLNKFLKNNKYDYIYINCYNSFGYIYALVASKYNKNIIIHGHNSSIDKDYLCIKRIINSLIKIIFRKNNYILIAPTKNVSKFCFSKESLIIENSINYQDYYFNIENKIYYKKLFNIKDEIVIGNIGRMEKQKNQLFLLDIFHDLLKINNNYKLIIIGNGSLKKKIVKKINKLNLENKVILIDKSNNIKNLINVFDIYLFPSLYEGLPLSLIENQVNDSYCITSNMVDKSVKISNKIEFIDLKKSSYEWACIINNLDLKKKLELNNKLDLNNFLEKIRKIIN